jgi:hypothetical protein
MGRRTRPQPERLAVPPGPATERSFGIGCIMPPLVTVDGVPEEQRNERDVGVSFAIGVGTEGDGHSRPIR